MSPALSSRSGSQPARAARYSARYGKTEGMASLMRRTLASAHKRPDLQQLEKDGAAGGAGKSDADAAQGAQQS